MRITKSTLFERHARAARQRLGYWVQSAKMDFAIALYRLLKEKQVSKTEFAERIGASQAYVTKVFSGDVNFTIESMVKLSRAVGGRLRVEVETAAAEAAFVPVPVVSARSAITPTRTSFSIPVAMEWTWTNGEEIADFVSPDCQCANDGNYAAAA
jgi:transcriptional regulator with XRE-family HTH domain